MKKIKLIISICLTIILVSLGFDLYSEISLNLTTKTNELKQTIRDCKQFITNKIDFYEALSLDLSTRANIDDFGKIGTDDITAIILLNYQKKVIKGFQIDPDGHKIEIKDPLLPTLNLDLGWVSIELDAYYRTAKASYIIPTTNQNFLFITFDLKESLNRLRSLNFGFNSYAYLARSLRENSLNYDIIFKPTFIDRILDNPFVIQSNFKSNWIFVFKGVYKDVFTYSLKIIQEFFLFIVFFGLVIISYYCYFVDLNLSKPIKIWILSILVDTYLILICVFLFWDMPSTGILIENRTASFRKIQEFFSKNPSICVIPTAVYINSLEFPTDSSFLITGFVSQIYPKDTPMEQGFVFPYQSTLYSPTIKEISRWEDELSVTILWQFGIGLSSPFSTKFFPFDKRSAEIILWPKELHKDVIFFPNFFNFQTLSNLTSPGISNELKPNGWDILFSSYLLKNTPPYQFFPPARTDSKITYTFTINLARNFLGAFLSNILVLFLCMFVAFLMLFIPRSSLLDSLFATISIFVGLIFIAVTNHSSLRTTLEVSSFSYCEYLFISFYILILAITIDFILRKPEKNFLKIPSDLLAILYWPTLLGVFTINLILSIFLS
jgi:hypothetical protein